MTIQDYGSIGELIGAIATVATLAYLAFQIRQNTLSAKATGAAANLEAVNVVTALIGESQDTADLYFNGLTNPDSLADSELFRFHMLLGLYVQYFQQAEELDSAGVLSSGAIHNRDSQLSWLATQPGFRSFQAEWGGTSDPRLERRIKEAIRCCDEEGRLTKPQGSPAAQQSAAADSPQS